MAFETYEPVLVRVRKGHWEAIPASSKGYTPREKDLIAEIRFAGGIDETVPDGFYHFNKVPWNGETKLILVKVRMN